MSSGHNSRKGRGGNRRDRQGSPRPHHPSTHSSAVLTPPPAITVATEADAIRANDVEDEEQEPYSPAESAYVAQQEVSDLEPAPVHRVPGAPTHGRPVHSIPFARATAARHVVASHQPLPSDEMHASSTPEFSTEQAPEPVDVRGELGPLIDSLHELFERDRAVASQGGSTRCGICYLYYKLSELTYRDADGLYVCGRCARALGSSSLRMIRRQQKL